MLAQIRKIFVQFHIGMSIALKFLESNGVIPNQRNLYPMLPAGYLGKVAPFWIPIRMGAVRIIPFHYYRLISCIKIMLNETCRIGLLIDQGHLRMKPEQSLINRIPDSEIRRIHLRRHKGANNLGIAAADEFAGAVCNKMF